MRFSKFAISIAALLLSSLCYAVTNSEQKTFGLGIEIGYPTGISFRSQLAPDRQFAAALGWTFDHIDAHADHLWLQKNFIVEADVTVDGYLGAGIFLALGNDLERHSNRETQSIHVGARMPLGLKSIFLNQRLEVFGEIVPGLQIVSSTEFELWAAIGARYLF